MSNLEHSCDGAALWVDKLGWFISSTDECPNAEKYMCYDATRDPDIAQFWFMTTHRSQTPIWGSTGDRSNPWEPLVTPEELDEFVRARRKPRRAAGDRVRSGEEVL